MPMDGFEAVLRQMYVNLALDGIDNPALTLAQLRDATGGGVNASRAANAANASGGVPALENRIPYEIEQLSRKVNSGSSFCVALAGDSTGDETVEWYLRAWDDYAIARPELTQTYKSWDHTAQAYTATSTRRTGVGVTLRPAWDTFTGSAGEIVGSLPERGQAWEGAAGAFILDGTSAAWVASTGYIRSDSSAPVGVRKTASGTISVDLVAGAANKRLNFGIQKPGTNIERLSIYVGITTGGTIQWGIEGQFPSFATLIAGGGTPLVAGVQTVPWSLEVNGATVTAILNGVSAVAALTAPQQTSVDNMSGVYIAGTNTLSSAWKINEIQLTAIDSSAAPTLSVVNASRPGSDLTYQQDRATEMFAVVSTGVIDALLISSSHNYGAASPETYLEAVEEFISTFKSHQPNAAIIVVAQSPQAYPATYRTQHAARIAVLASFAAANGYGYIDAFSAFLVRSDWASTLVRADGVHPTANNASYDGTVDPNNGQYVWKEAALAWLADSNLLGTPPIIATTLTYSRTGETAHTAALRAALAASGIVYDNTVA